MLTIGKNDKHTISIYFQKEKHFLSLVDVLFRNENEELYQIFSSIENKVEDIREDLSSNVIRFSDYFSDKKNVKVE